LAYQ
jgi:hypothetical protein